MMKSTFRVLFLSVTALLLLGACAILTPEQTITPPSTTTPTTIPQIEPTESVQIQTRPIILWVAPQFAPETPAGLLLSARLEAFEAQRPQVRISVRTKPESGAGGLLEALEAASVAAPTVVPSLLTLSADDLALAVEANLARPLPDSLIQPENTGWYDYALPQSRLGGVSYGLPFASELEIFAYRSDLYSSPPRSWDTILSEAHSMLFPAADPRARFILAMYLGAGGELTDSLGLPDLDLNSLEQVLVSLASARTSLILPLSARQFSSPEETWLELRANRTASAMAPLSTFMLDADPERFAATALPTDNGQGIGLASTWSWVMTPAADPQQELLFELLAWLSDPAFQGSFTHALGLLPTSQEVLTEWPDDADSALVSRLVTITRAEPDQNLRAIITPALLAAVEAVLGTGQDPATAAADALELIGTP